MCGIGGFFLSRASHENFDASLTLDRILKRLSKRGPDSNGKWLSHNRHVGICHTRLAIIDINDRSTQPMLSLCGRYIITFNGEIYNYKELRKSLLEAGVLLRTTSDTEVVLELFALYQQKMLDKLRGMFAFAIYDVSADSLFIARDPYGIKPLYIAKNKNGWVFSSQVKALIDTKLISKSPSIYGQFGFWLYGSVPEPYTWYEDISALQPGSWILINSTGISPPVKFNNISEIWTNNNSNGGHSFDEIKSSFQHAIRDSVSDHLVSDVPIGLFLSGGVDSGALAGVISETTDNITGITLKFDEFDERNDESIHASLIAKSYGINHHIRRVGKNEFSDDIETILYDMDQPTIDGFNTWYASKAASEIGIKVCLSGVGADEILCGYPSFSRVPLFKSLWNSAARYGGLTNFIKLMIPYILPKSKAERVCTMPSNPIDLASAYWIQRGLHSPKEVNQINPKMFSDLTNIIPSFFIENYFDSLPENPLLAVSLLESRSYLRNQLLRDCDWASMAHGVELRTPFVDATLLSNVASLIPKFSNGVGKQILSDTPRIPLPKIITQKKKTGLGIPVSSWIDSENLVNFSGKRSAVKLTDSRTIAHFVAENY